MHIVQVQKGNLACIMVDNIPRLYPEGTHCFRTPLFAMFGEVSTGDQCIKFGTITRFLVKKGEIGLAWENNVPILVREPGVYYKDSKLFMFDKCISAATRIVELGSKRIFFVGPAEVGVLYTPHLKILQPGTHIFDDPALLFQGFLDTRETCLRLRQEFDPAKHKHGEVHSEKDILICDTKEFVQVGIKADMYYRVKFPEKCVYTVGLNNEIDFRMNELGKAAINSITRNSSLAEIAQSKAQKAQSMEEKDSRAAASGTPSAPVFEKVHDEFLAKLHDTCLRLYGVEIINIRIESFKIMDEKLSAQISGEAKIIADIGSQLVNLMGKTKVAVADEQRVAEVKRIESEAYSTALHLKVTADNDAVISESRAKSEAVVIAAEASGQSILKKKEAEAEGLRLLGRAEAKRATMLAESGLGREIALAEIYGKALERSVEGLDAIVYLPTEKGMFNSTYDIQSALNLSARPVFVDDRKQG